MCKMCEQDYDPFRSCDAYGNDTSDIDWREIFGHQITIAKKSEVKTCYDEFEKGSYSLAQLDY